MPKCLTWLTRGFLGQQQNERSLHVQCIFSTARPESWWSSLQKLWRSWQWWDDGPWWLGYISLWIHHLSHFSAYPMYHASSRSQAVWVWLTIDVAFGHFVQCKPVFISGLALYLLVLGTLPQPRRKFTWWDLSHAICSRRACNVVSSSFVVHISPFHSLSVLVLLSPLFLKTRSTISRHNIKKLLGEEQSAKIGSLMHFSNLTRR